MSTAVQSPNRQIFLDNLRYALVLAVVFEHAAHAYDGLSWWPVAEGRTSLLTGWASTLSDGLSMPLLFFIAGFFALPGIRSRGLAGFLVGKLKRLGLPWLVCLVTICPILPLVYHYTRNGQALTRSFADIWSSVMADALSFKIRLIDSMSSLMQADLFYQRYMWFLSLLLLFFVIFALIHTLWPKWFKTPRQFKPSPRPTIGSTLGMLGWLGLLTVAGGFVSIGVVLLTVPGLSNPEPLFSLGGIIQFRTSRLWSYALYFFLGIMAFRNQWFERARLAGHLPTWALSFTLLAVASLYCRQLMIARPEQAEILGPIFFVVLNLLTAAGLGFFTSLAQRYWNRSQGFDRALAKQSYAIYLAHYPLVIIAQLALLNLDWLPGSIKFVLVGLFGIGGGWLAGRYLINSRPRLALVSAFGILALMLIFIRP